MRSIFSKVLAGVFVSFGLVGVSQAQEYKMSSLEARTQVGLAGTASFNSAQTLTWATDVSALHYLTPRFGVGGLVFLAGGNRENLAYSVGPMAEYFVPVADRQHIYGQAAVTVAGMERADSNFGLGASLGYRYFVMDNVSIGAKLNRNWAKSTDSGSKVRAIDATNLLVGFSIFM